MLTADTITDEQIRELRRATMGEWALRGKRRKWPEGSEILSETLIALGNPPGGCSPGKTRARARCAEILNARDGART